MRTDFDQVARQTHFDGAGLVRLQIVNVECAELFVDDGIRMRRGGLEVQAVVLDRFGNLLRLGVVGEERYWAVPVRQEVDGVSHPHRIKVVRIIARNFHCARIGQCRDPDGGGLAAPIPFPRPLPFVGRNIGELGAVGGI